MNLKRVFTIFLRQLLLIKRSVHRTIGIFYWSVIELFLWGFLTVYLAEIGEDRFNFMTVVIGTVILWNFLMRIQQGITISFLEDVWSRNFMNLFASPLKINEYVAGLVMIAMLSALISIGSMAGVAWLLFAYNIFQFGFFMLPFIFVLFFFGLALGLYTTAMILRFGPSSEILAWSIPALLPPFSGIFYPVSALPGWLQVVANFIPPAYVFEGMRSIVLSGSMDWNSLGFAGFLSLLFFAGAYLLLIKTYRYALRKGFFTRFMTD